MRVKEGDKSVPARSSFKPGRRNFIKVAALGSMVVTTSGISYSFSLNDPYLLLGQPCRAKQVLGGTIIRDRNTSKEMLVLTNMNEVSGAELIFIDLETGSGELFRAPAGAGSWNVREVPGDRLVIGTFYDGTFLIFDLKNKQFVHHVRFSKEEYLWNTAIGSDGRIYAGSYPGGRLGALNLENYSVEDCGAPAAPNLYLRYVSPTPDSRMLCYFTNEKPVTKLYDPLSRQWSDVPDSLKGIETATVFNGLLIGGGKVFSGKDFKPVPPPFPTPGEGWQAETSISNEKTLFMRLDKGIYMYRNGFKKAELVSNIDLRGGRYLAATADGDLTGIRGQDYFIIRRGSSTLDLKPIPTESGPRNLLFLRIDPRGRIWSGPPFGQTLCYFDPVTGKSENTRTICDNSGEVYDVEFYKGKVYAVAYAGGDIVQYDPESSWDQWKGTNPKTIATVGTSGYIRPVGGIFIGPEEKLYSGWMAKYGVYGGAIAITDPSTGVTELIENPLGGQTVASLIADGSLLYAGSSRSANGLPLKPDDSACFGIIEISSGKTIWRHTFEGSTHVTRLAFDSLSELVVMSVDGQLYTFSTKTRSVPAIVKNAPPLISRNSVTKGDGTVLYGSENKVIILNLADSKFRVIATLPKPVESLALGPDSKIYISCGPDIYLITDTD